MLPRKMGLTFVSASLVVLSAIATAQGDEFTSLWTDTYLRINNSGTAANNFWLASDADAGRPRALRLWNGNYPATGTPLLAVTPDGQLGIGTTSPGTPFDFQYATTNLQARIYNTNDPSTGNWAELGLNLKASSGVSRAAGRIKARLTTIEDANRQGLMILNTQVNAVPTDVLTIAGTPSGGCVGIGTTTPSYPLEVNGKVYISGQYCSYGFHSRDTSENWELLGSTGAARLLCGGYERFTVTADGRVGIGTPGPQYALDVVGAFRNSGPVGIGTPPGSSSLTVAGTVEASNFKMVAGAGAGLVLTSDANGVGSWVASPWLTTGADIQNSNSGNVGIGTPSPQAKLDVAGQTRTCSLQITGGCDLAEPFVVAKPKSQGAKIEPGTVVVIDPDHPGRLKLSSEPYDRKMAGIVSGANGLDPGMVMSAANNPATRPAEDTQDSALGARHSDHPVALTGRVWCWCDASYGAIAPGDRLTTSDTPGHAMKVADRERADGAVIGKAMSKLEKDKGLVLVLVQPQ